MVCVVAEIGVNHDGSAQKAMWLMNAAADAGANAVKFQLYDAKKLEPPGARCNMLVSLALPQSVFPSLKKHAESKGLEFLCTPFDVDSLEFLVKLGVRRIKVSSGGLRDIPLLHAIRETGLEVILSTGMATLQDIRNAMIALNWPKVFMLQCTSAYPTQVKDVNLLAMQTLKYELGGIPGLSDHTTSIFVPAAAVALGAQMIEKHLTIKRNGIGPDHKASLEPSEFKQMVQGIRDVESALGIPDKFPLECEQPVMKIRDAREKWRTR